MDNLFKQENENIQKQKSKGSTVESLVSLLVTTCYSRINLSDASKLDNLRQQFKEMLSMEENKYPDEKQKYDYLRNIMDLFFDYITDEKVVDKIKNGKLSKKNIESDFLANLTNVPKRKFDMKDLYRSDLIASVEKNSNVKNVKMSFKNSGQEHIYTDANGKHFKLTDIGSILYEEWGGIRSDLTIYQLEKEQSRGKFLKELICTRIIIAEMGNPKYKRAVLEELLSDDNIHKSNAGIYIGQILRRKQSGNNDLPHTETQTTNEYTYRIDDEYVLEYDATELSAVVEAIKQFISYGSKDKSGRNSYNSFEHHDEQGDR